MGASTISRIRLCTTILAAWFALIAGARADQLTTVVDLGLGFVPVKVTDSGDVYGSWNGHAAVYHNGQFQQLDLGGLNGTSAADGNASGWVVGNTPYNTSTSLSGQAFLSRGPGDATVLGALNGPGSQATAINAAGQVIGEFGTSSGATHVFLYSNSQMSDIGTLGGSSSWAGAINSLGQVTGVSLTADGANHAFLYSNGKMTDLGTLGGASSTASAIDNLGRVFGVSQAADGNMHAFRYDSGGMHDLGSLAAGDTPIYGGLMNTLGQAAVQGYVKADDGSLLFREFLVDGGHAISLSDLLPPGSVFSSINTATSINDVGQVVGYGLVNGELHAYLLTTAVPEPGAILLFAAAGAVGWRLRRRKAV